MTYEELLQYGRDNGINIEGMELWVTDVRLSNGEELIRNIEAEKYVVVPASDAPRTIYYATHALQKIGKKGTPIKQYTPFYDNTGYRRYTGESVNVYFTEDEAKKKLAEQYGRIERYYQHKLEEYQSKKDSYKNKIMALKNEQRGV